MSKKNKKIYPAVDNNFIDLQNKFNDVRAELEEHGADNRHSYPLLNELTTKSVEDFYKTFITNKKSDGNQDPSVFIPNEGFLKSKYGISNIDNKTTDPAKKQEYVNKMSRFIQTVTKFATIYNKVVYAIGTLSTEAVTNINEALESIKNDEYKAKVESLLTELNNKPEFQNSDLEKLSGKVPEITAEEINNIVNKYLSKNKLNMSVEALETFDVDQHVDELDLPIDLNSDTNLESLKKVRLNDGVSTIETELDKLNKTIKRDLKAVVEALKAGIRLAKEKTADAADEAKLNEIKGILDGYSNDLNGVPENTEVTSDNLDAYNTFKTENDAKIEEIKTKLEEVKDDPKLNLNSDVNTKVSTLEGIINKFKTFSDNITALVGRFKPNKPEGEKLNELYTDLLAKSLLTKEEEVLTNDEDISLATVSVPENVKKGTPYNVAELEELLDDFNKIEKDKYVDAVKREYNFDTLLNEEGMTIDDTSDLSDIEGIIRKLESRLENANNILAKYTSKDPKLEEYKGEINDTISKLNEKLEAARQAETNKENESTEPGNGDTTGGDGTEGGSGDNGEGTSDGNTSTDTTEGEDSNTDGSGDGDTSGTGTEPNTGNGDTDTEETPEADTEYDAMVEKFTEEYNKLTADSNNALLYDIASADANPSGYLPVVEAFKTYLEETIKNYPETNDSSAFSPERKSKWDTYKTDTLDHNLTIAIARIKELKEYLGITEENENSTEEEPAPTEEPNVEKLKQISDEIDEFKNTINVGEHNYYAGLDGERIIVPSPYVDAVAPISRAEKVKNILALINELKDSDKVENDRTTNYLANINEFISKKVEKNISEDYLKKIGKSPTGKNGLWSIYEKLYKDSIDIEDYDVNYIIEDSRGEFNDLDGLYNILNDKVNGSEGSSTGNTKMSDKIDSIINKIGEKADIINYFIKMDDYKYESETDPDKYDIIKVIKPLEEIKAKLLEKEEAKKREAANKLEAFKAELDKITTSYTAVDGAGLSGSEKGAVNFITTLINDVNNIVNKVYEAKEHHPDFDNEREGNTYKTEYPELFKQGILHASKKLMDYLAAASDRKNGFGKTTADWIDSLNRLWNRKSTEEFSTDSKVYKSILYTLENKEKIRGMLKGEAETAFQLNRFLMGSNGIFSVLESLKEYYDSTIEAKGHKDSLDGVDIPELVINNYLEKYNAFKAGTITSTQALKDLEVNDDSELVTETLANYETNKVNDITYYDSLNNEKAGLLEKERTFETNKNDEDRLDGDLRYRIPNKLDRIKLDVIHRHETILDIKAKINVMIEDKNKVVETISTTIEMPMSIISSERDVDNRTTDQDI